jgi:hypothetical protein
MPSKRRNAKQSQQDRQNEYMRGGKDQRDQIGGSGIYPASAPNAPAHAEIRSESELVRHQGPPQKPTEEQGFKKSDRSSGSE